jgi:transposase
MTRKRRKSTKVHCDAPVIRKDAAGIDIGARQIHAAVPADRDSEPVRTFAVFTEDLLALADWLQAVGIGTVAMESTGVYWIPLYQILEARGIEVYLVNARHVKNVPGRKSDVSDCQWLQFLHSVGLLNGSFRPEQDICVVRALLRQRDSLVRMAASHVQQMQKALNQMNVQIHHVISDLTGQTGLAIVDAILAGRRDPQELARLRDRRIKASPETIAKSLVGDYRPEHLFTLKQALSSYRHGQQMMAGCDQEISQHLVQLEALCEPLPAEPAPAAPVKRGPGRPRGSNTAEAKLQRQLHRIFGVDLTKVPGFNVTTVLTLFTEVGPDLSQFRCAPALASWLGLCPGNKVSGGKILDAKTRRVQSRAAEAFRMAAFSLHGSQSCLGSFYRRMRAKLGAPKAITAAAHKLARIFFHLVTTKQPYDASVFAQQEAAHRNRREQRLKAEARACGYQLTPIAATAE